MTEQQRQEQYKQDCRINAFEIFLIAGECAAQTYLSHKFSLLKAYQTDIISLLELNNEF